MHGEAGFQKTRALLVDRGFAEDDVQAYTGEAFGSWLVTLRTSPRLRIILDGKDDWAIIAAELSSLPRPRGYSEWRDFWIGKRPEDIMPDAVVSGVQSLSDITIEVARRQEHLSAP